MITLDFQKCVFSITESLLFDLSNPEHSIAPGQIDDVSRIILSRQASLPDYLRGPFKMITVFFDAAPILTHGRPFHKLRITHRKKIVDKWRHSPLANKRDFIRFFETFSTLAYYSFTGGASTDAAHSPQ